MKRFLFSTLLVSTCLFVNAQDANSRKAAEEAEKKMLASGELKEGWTKGGVLNVNLNHNSNDNWQGASEKYALAINGNLNYFAYRKWGKYLWKNDLLLAYGVLRTPSSFDKFRKNDDRLNLSSMIARQVKKNLYYAGALDVITQMTPSYDYKSVDTTEKSGYSKVSNFLTPGNIRLGVGALWQPRANLSIYFSPATANIYTKMDKDFRAIDAFGVNAGQSIRFGLGALARADYFTTINKNFTYKTRVMAFTDYLYKPFTVVDLDWMNTLMFNATKYIGVKLDVNFRYYEGQIKKLQIQEMLGVGFAYKF